MRRADFDTQDTMRHILDFKAGRRYATKWAADLVARTLAPMDLTNTIIVSRPTSAGISVSLPQFAQSARQSMASSISKS